MKTLLFSIFMLFISAISLIGAGTHRIGSWNAAIFEYAIDSEAKKLEIKMSRPRRKTLFRVIPHISWQASFRPFTNPDIKGSATINVQMRKLNWDKIRKMAQEDGNEHAAYLFAHNLLSNRRYGEAAHFLKVACHKGHSDAMNDLGVLSLFGMGVPRNISSAYEMFRKSASNGIPMGNFNVGLCRMMGLGCRQNFQSAKAHIKRAADQNLPIAEAILAINHAIGTPIASKDHKKAYKLALLARAHGFGWGLDVSSSYYYVDLSALERYIEYFLSDNEIERIQKTIPSDTGHKSPYRKSHINIIGSYKQKPNVTVIGPDTNSVPVMSFEDIPYMGTP